MLKKYLVFFWLSCFCSLANAGVYVCAPLSGEENFKNSDYYRLVRSGDNVVLSVLGSETDSWNYTVFYSVSGKGFRASRSIRGGNDELSKLYSIAVGGELTLMDNFQDGEGIKVFVTYSNAYSNSGNAGKMFLYCEPISKHE